MDSPWLLLLLVASVSAGQCPDGTQCSGKTLCCELPGGNGYGCCLEEKVVSRSLPMITSVISCTEHTGCPEEYSCVNTPQGGSACCPIAQGSSCQDGHHCCPSGSQCSDDGHHCIPVSNMTAVTCPDKRSECPSDASCCQMADQSWGCCPMPKATCCRDGLHCCPSNSVCDLENGMCLSENGQVSLSRKFPARIKLFAATHKCDDTTVCPSSSSCCRLASGQWGCCPIKKASDQNVQTFPQYRKVPAQKYEGYIPEADGEPASSIQPLSVVWCDATHYCADGTTCCLGIGGSWGCCPYTLGVCCPDRVHCCPYGHVCLSSGTYCSRSGNPRWDLGYGDSALL